MAHIAGTTAAAAAAQQRRMQFEEEEMTGYEKQELADDWEFKIIRSSTGAFKNPQKLRAILDEESQAGWVLVEKFDNGRVRLKRPASARRNDANLTIDAYRTSVGVSDSALAITILAVIFGVIGFIALIAILMN
jgi:hypothetical protein